MEGGAEVLTGANAFTWARGERPEVPGAKRVFKPPRRLIKNLADAGGKHGVMNHLRRTNNL